MIRCRFKVDENLPDEAAQLLRAAGHDAHSVLEQSLGGSPDSSIARICRVESRAVVTLDRDFANIRAYPPAAYSGLVVLRLGRQDKPHVLATLRRLLPLFQSEHLSGHLWIVEDERLRIRD